MGSRSLRDPAMLTHAMEPKIFHGGLSLGSLDTSDRDGLASSTIVTLSPRSSLWWSPAAYRLPPWFFPTGRLGCRLSGTPRGMGSGRDSPQPGRGRVLGLRGRGPGFFLCHKQVISRSDRMVAPRHRALSPTKYPRRVYPNLFVRIRVILRRNSWLLNSVNDPWKVDEGDRFERASC